MKTSFYTHEVQSVAALALIFAFRMLGLFMILPVFSISAVHLAGATPELIGLGLGIYGLTQALCQIPLGMLSDRIGRKLVIAGGLVLFLLGSVLAACASSIIGIIVGRAVQGAGAVGSVVLALLSDVTKIENRTRAMAVIGASIGFAFMLSMIVGPIIYEFFALSGLFWATALMALIGLWILYIGVKIPNKAVFQPVTQGSTHFFKRVMLQPELWRLNLGIFIQHAVLTASFIVIPKLLSDQLHLPVTQYWKFYLPVFTVALIGAFPLIFLSEKRRFVRGAVLSCVAIMGLSQMLLAYFELLSVWVITVLSVFFIAFTLLEAFLPSLVSKIAPIKSKGAAMGIYSTAQFLGIFLGGSLGGVVFFYFGLHGVFGFNAILVILWLLVAIPMKSPPYLVTKIFNVGRLTAQEANTLGQAFLSVGGVSEAVVIPDEKAAYLKVDLCRWDETLLQKIIKQLNVEKSNGKRCE